MTAAATIEQRTFTAFANRNFRRYFVGQVVSQIGTWMQYLGQSWLVYKLTGSGTVLGITVALQSVPMFLFGPYGGLVADRYDKRRLVIGLQAVMGVLALVLGVLALTHVVQVWQVYVLALLVGVARVFEIPARQTFLLEMVGPEHIRNAVGLNSVIPNGARAIGPAIAGVTIATVGVGICFIINAASFIAIVVMLLTLDVDRLTPSQPAGRSPGQLREGVRYVLSSPVLVVPMLMTALIGCFSIQWLVALPILASGTFHGGPRTYGFMMGAVGTGAVIGALLVARRGRTGLAPLVTYAALLGIALLAATLAPVLPLEFIALVSYGLCAVTFTSSCNATVQLASAPQMRGRVIALWLVGLDGLNPIGAPTIGAVGGIAGGRWALAVGAAAALAATCVGAFALRARRGLSPSLATDVAALMTELA